MMQGRLSGKTAIVTGASRGIGFAVAGRLVEEGARVVITARGADALADAAASLGGPSKVQFVAGRADDPEHRDLAVSRAIESFGSVDLLVNNVGINPVYGDLVDLELTTASKIFQVNCLSLLAWVQTAHARWMRLHGGAIVNITSAAGLRAAPGIGFYGASKAMVGHFTQQLAFELAPDIRVNAVAPAVVKTKFASALFLGDEEDVASPYPMKRLGLPEDVAGVVAFLLSEDAAWMTGQIVAVDGGIGLTRARGTNGK